MKVFNYYPVKSSLGLYEVFLQQKNYLQCQNLMNLSRVLNPPKTHFNWAPAYILKYLIQF